MAFRFDRADNSLVIDGFQNGIADSPHDGISDMRNVNIISVPGEGSVNFKTQSVAPPNLTVSVISASAGDDTITYSGAVESLVSLNAIMFSATTIGGLSTNTLYYISRQANNIAKLYTDHLLANLVNITSDGTGTFSTIQIGQPKYATTDDTGKTFMVDANGRVWTDLSTTSEGSWIYLGNTTLTNASGNGIVSYYVTDGTALGSARYLFVFRNGLIDYIKNPAVSSTWTYGWNPATGTTGNTGTVLKTFAGSSNPHEAMLAPDGRIYFTDSNWVDRFYQTDPTVTFDPTLPATYTWDQTQLLPATDLAQCLAFLGTNLLVGGQDNVIYPWNRYDNQFNYPILLPESNVSKMVTVNTNTYIFAGNRGRIYVTNGSSVNLFKKVPDHISGTVEPYFAWGGACSSKNQLYFSVSATTNAGVAITQYGGVWAIDLDSKAIRLTNKLSYNTYAGYATVLIPNFNSNPAGAGIFIGWDSGATTYGIDKTISTPYTSSEATIDSDLIPIGTFNKPQNFGQVEFKLTRPLVSGESISVKTRLVFNTSDTGYTSTLSNSTAGNYSATAASNIKNAQWVQFQITLSSTASSPSYVRVKEMRIKLQ